jgi:hypothetical protein
LTALQISHYVAKQKNATNVTGELLIIFPIYAIGSEKDFFLTAAGNYMIILNDRQKSKIGINKVLQQINWQSKN